MKILLHPRNDALPVGSYADLREIPSSVLPGSIITPGSTRRLPFHDVRAGAIPGRGEYRHRPSLRALMARAA